MSAIVLWLGYYWLGIGETRAATLLWSGLIAVVVAALACWTYGASLAFFDAGQNRRVSAAWKAALRNLFPLAVAAAAAAFIYYLLSIWDDYSSHPAFQVASYLTLKLRKPVRPASVLRVFRVVLGVVQWAALPVLLLPMIAAISSHGWSGFRGAGALARKVAVLDSSAASAVVLALGAARNSRMDSACSQFRDGGGELHCPGAGRLFAIRGRVAGAGIRDFERHSAFYPIEDRGFPVAFGQARDHCGCIGVSPASKRRVAGLAKIRIGRNPRDAGSAAFFDVGGQSFPKPNRKRGARLETPSERVPVRASALNPARCGCGAPRPAANECAGRPCGRRPNRVLPWRCGRNRGRDRCAARRFVESSSVCVARALSPNRSAEASATRS